MVVIYLAAISLFALQFRSKDRSLKDESALPKVFRPP
jgi:hypothetical protein